jgi:predicted transcriptional regulator
MTQPRKRVVHGKAVLHVDWTARGRAIRDRRKALGLSQTAFARHIEGATRNVIVMTELGSNKRAIIYAFCERVLSDLEAARQPQEESIAA